MAFTVSPTSGVGPYVLHASFENKVNIDGVHYVLEVRSTTQRDECLVGVSDSPIAVNTVLSLLSTGSSEMTTNVATEFCRTTSLIIRNVETGDIVDSSNVYVDNL